MRDPQTALQAEGLSKRYRRRLALDRLSLSVPAGVVYGLLGPNGAGKSTALRLFLGLAAPTEGVTRVFGHDVQGERLRVLRLVGASVEMPAFFAYLTARQNLRLLADLSGGVGNAAIDETLESVGLADRADDRVAGFSHGMKQRLGIAQALLHKPRLIILDEPTSGLDPFGVVEVRHLIRRLVEREGVTVVLSSHLLAEAQQLCDRVAIIGGGKLIAEGVVRELLRIGETVYSVQALPVDRAREVVRGIPDVEPLESPDGTLQVRATTEGAAALNRALIDEGVAVWALVPHEPTLEDVFLKVASSRHASPAGQDRDEG